MPDANDHGQDPADEQASAVLAYGTHDRAGPWWRRWLRAWWRAARMALLITAIATALMYALAPREYTAVATVDVEQDVVDAARAAATTPKMDAARADALVLSLKQTDYLQQVLDSPAWRIARTDRPGKTAFEPIDGERIPGTKTVRIRFTDWSAERARVGADAAVTALHPINDPDAEDPAAVIERALGPLAQQQRQLVARLAAQREREAAGGAATQPSPRQPAQLLGTASRAQVVRGPGYQSAWSLNRQLMTLESRIAVTERKLASVPRVKRLEAATTPRFASNQKDLLLTSVSAAGVVFPLAFIVAMYHSWRYRRAATTQVSAGDRIMSVGDLAILMFRSPARRRWSAAVVPALGPAAIAALIAAAISCSLAPRQYSATATLAPTTAPAAVRPSPAVKGSVPITPADAYAALATAANSPDVLREVVESPQWKLVRGGDATSNAWSQRARIDATSDAQGISVTFTDADPDAARYGADMAMTIARNVVRQALQPYPPRLSSGRYQSRVMMPAGSRSSFANPAEIARMDAISVVVRQLPATVVSVSRWPANAGEIAQGTIEPAAEAFGLALLLAVLWFHRRATRRAVPAANHGAGGSTSMLARVPFQLATTMAVFVGLVGYTVAPRTYSATATLQVQLPVPGEVPRTMPTATMVSRIAEVIPTAPRSAVKLNCDTGEIHITYTALDPSSACERANSTAVSVSNTWLDRIFQSALQRVSRGQDAGMSNELKDWSALGGSTTVAVVRPAMAPRWADQFQPIRIAALAATFAFAVVLPALTLGRTGRHRSIDRGTISLATTPRGGGARFVPA